MTPKFIDIMGLQKVLLPKPGCSNGGLDWETEVKPLLERYPYQHIIDILEKP